MNNININGNDYSVKGKNISVVNDKVIVDGVVVAQGLSGIVKIEFTGDLASLDCTTAVIKGNVKGDVDGTTITVNGSVEGNVDGTTITCGDVGGDVDGTTVKALTIKGNVDANTVHGGIRM